MVSFLPVNQTPHVLSWFFLELHFLVQTFPEYKSREVCESTVREVPSLNLFVYTDISLIGILWFCSYIFIVEIIILNPIPTLFRDEILLSNLSKFVDRNNRTYYYCIRSSLKNPTENMQSFLQYEYLYVPHKCPKSYVQRLEVGGHVFFSFIIFCVGRGKRVLAKTFSDSPILASFSEILFCRIMPN